MHFSLYGHMFLIVIAYVHLKLNVRLFIATKGEKLSSSYFVAVKRCICLIFACYYCVTGFKRYNAYY